MPIFIVHGYPTRLVTERPSELREHAFITRAIECEDMETLGKICAVRFGYTNLEPNWSIVREIATPSPVVGNPNPVRPDPRRIVAGLGLGPWPKEGRGR